MLVTADDQTWAIVSQAGASQSGPAGDQSGADEPGASGNKPRAGADQSWTTGW